MRAGRKAGLRPAIDGQRSVAAPAGYPQHQRESHRVVERDPQPNLFFKGISGLFSDLHLLVADERIHNGRGKGEYRQSAVTGRGPGVLAEFGPAHVEVIAAAGISGFGTGDSAIGIILAVAVAAADGDDVVRQGIILDGFAVVGQRGGQRVE